MPIPDPNASRSTDMVGPVPNADSLSNSLHGYQSMLHGMTVRSTRPALTFGHHRLYADMSELGSYWTPYFQAAMPDTGFLGCCGTALWHDCIRADTRQL